MPDASARGPSPGELPSIGRWKWSPGHVQASSGAIVINALQTCALLDVLVNTVFIRKGHTVLALVEVAVIAIQSGKGSGLPGSCPLRLFNGRMSAFTVLFLIAASDHLEEGCRLVVSVGHHSFLSFLAAT